MRQKPQVCEKISLKLESVFSVFLVAVSAIYRPAFCGLEGHFALLLALIADRIIHGPVAKISIFSFVHLFSTLLNTAFF